MKVAILGGGSPFALNTARYCLSCGHDVIGIGRSPLKSQAFTLGAVERGYQYHVIHLVREQETALSLLERERPEVIVNYAAQGEGAASFDPGTNFMFYDTNATALVRLVGRLQMRDWLKRFIHIGSSEVYGSTVRPSVETDALRPTSPYAISKAAFDQHLLSLHRTHGFPMNIVRPSNGYCEGQQLHRIIPRAICCALSGEPLQLQGGGKAMKSYLHGDDISRAIFNVLDAGKVGAVYNVGPEKAVSISFIVGMIERLLPDLTVQTTDARTGEDSRYEIDSAALTRDTGWTQTIGLQSGLTRMIGWLKAHPELWTAEHAYRLRA